MIRVVVADDEALVRLGLRVLLETEDDLALAGEAGDGRATVELVRRTRPDVVLLDVRMPGMDGLQALRAIAAAPELAGIRVIMLTTFELDEYVFEALRDGASGFLIKNTEPAELLHAVRVVAAGGSLLSPTVTRRVIGEFVARRTRRPAPHPGLHALTQREREVIRAHPCQPRHGEAGSARPRPAGGGRLPVRPGRLGRKLTSGLATRRRVGAARRSCSTNVTPRRRRAYA